MKKILRSTVVFASCLALACALTFGDTAASAQDMAPMAPVTDHGKSVDGKPLASPAATATVMLFKKPVTIAYNTPSMRGRKIMGNVVPYGQVWRTGANPATSFVTAVPLKIGAVSVPVGSYTLYTLPGAPGTPWQLIISKQTGQWGTVYKPEMDLARIEMKTGTLSAPLEVMNISFEDVHRESAQLHIKWETTDVSVKISANLPDGDASL